MEFRTNTLIIRITVKSNAIVSSTTREALGLIENVMIHRLKRIKRRKLYIFLNTLQLCRVFLEILLFLFFEGMITSFFILLFLSFYPQLAAALKHAATLIFDAVYLCIMLL